MNRIKEVLDEKGIKQTWLAEQLGKSYNMVNAYVQNRQQPRIELLYEIAEILGVNVKELLIDNEIKKDKKMSNEQKITTDIKAPNKDWEILKTHFSHCFDKDGKFDFAKFQKELESQNVELSFEKESYGLDWLGKSYARLLASDPATTLLKADATHNQKPENIISQNLLIKGDNLEVLKHLANAYYEKVKMIYIDPPYNTGSDGFVYNDDRKYTVEQLQELLGIDKEKAKRILDFTQSKSNSHSAWLTFMYPRLYIAKQLLRDDGVIFVSIDDNEVAQLRLLMDEVFGEENFVVNFIRKSGNAPRQDIKYIANAHDYILCYSKNITNLKIFKKKADTSRFRYQDEYHEKRGKFDLNQLDRGSKQYSESLDYPIIIEKDEIIEVFDSKEVKKIKSPKRVEIWPAGDPNDTRWIFTWSKDKVKWGIENGFIVFREMRNDKWKVYYKEYELVDNEDKPRDRTNPYDTLILDTTNEFGTADIENLFHKRLFEYSKPSILINYIQKIGISSSDIILDFFAGSGTTGDAVMQLNAEDGGNRKYILVQLPEPIDPKKNQTAYDFVKNELKAEPTIFEITKERLLRAAKKIKEETIHKKIAEKEKQIKDLESQLDLENKEEQIAQLKKEIQTLQNQDLGFKIFETMPIWEDYDFEAEEFDNSLNLFDESKLTEEDIKALLTTWKTYDGIALTQELESVVLSADSLDENKTQNSTLNTKNYTAYYGNGKLYLMHKGFTTDHLKALLEKVDTDKHFDPKTIIAFGYHFESSRLRELSENVKNYSNKKHIDIEFIIRY